MCTIDRQISPLMENPLSTNNSIGQNGCSSSQAPISFNDLPGDVVNEIKKYFDSKKDFLSFTAVNKPSFDKRFEKPIPQPIFLGSQDYLWLY